MWCPPFLLEELSIHAAFLNKVLLKYFLLYISFILLPTREKSLFPSTLLSHTHTTKFLSSVPYILSLIVTQRLKDHVELQKNFLAKIQNWSVRWNYYYSLAEKYIKILYIFCIYFVDYYFWDRRKIILFSNFCLWLKQSPYISIGPTSQPFVRINIWSFRVGKVESIWI